MTEPKIQPQHQKRQASVYIRQSTMHQVRENRASTELQYDLVDRAIALGWRRDSVKIYDGDLGTTASVAAQREDFRQLVADVGLGRIGIILGFDVTRIARNNADWYKLLDLCGVCDTLIADLDGIYDPALYNDRLLLGMKGTMSEAESHFIRTRLHSGIEKKAAKGTLRKRLPVGFEYDDEGHQKLCADESVRTAIALVFKRFQHSGSAHAVYRHFQSEGLLLPARRYEEKTIRWVRPRYGAIIDILTNLHYAGAYAYGRRRVQRIVDQDGQIRNRVEHRRRKDWKVLIEEHHSGYISWEQFEANQQRLTENIIKSPGEASRVVRRGRGLLAGLMRCGLCGRRMTPVYPSKHRGDSVRYSCNRLNRIHGSEGVCQSMGGTLIQNAVVEAFLQALSPASMQVALSTIEHMDAEEDAVLKQLEQRREQAVYEADRARRRYEAVEPENRTVARTLETEWNRRLVEQDEIDRQIVERLDHLPPPLTSAERERVLELGLDLRRVWEAETTTPEERKQLLRAVFEDVVVKVDRSTARASVTLVWQGGATTDLEVQLRRTGQTDRVTDEQIVDDVRKMAQSMTDKQIAGTLVRRGVRTATGLPYNEARVEGLRKRHGISAYQPQETTNDEPTYTAEETAEKLGVTVATVLRWLREGFLVGEQVAPRAPWRIRLGSSTMLKVADRAPKGWLPPKAAAQALGVSRRTVLHWVQTGRLEAVLGGKGRRSGLRINVSSGTFDKQHPLFDQPSARGEVQ